MASSMTMDAGLLLRSLSETQIGAAADFYAVAEDVLRPIVTDARSRWPVKTGTTRGNFRLTAGRRQNGALFAEISTRSGNPYPVDRQKWSRYSLQARQDMAAKYATEKAERGTTPETQRAIYDHWYQRRLNRLVGRSLGLGMIPPIGMERKQPWRELILKPVKAGTGPLVRRLGRQLSALAGR